MQPLIIRNPHKTPLHVRISPGHIDIAVPPGDEVEIEVHDMPEGAAIEIEHDVGPALTLTIPTSQFRFHRRGERRAA